MRVETQTHPNSFTAANYIAKGPSWMLREGLKSWLEGKYNFMLSHSALDLRKNGKEINLDHYRYVIYTYLYLYNLCIYILYVYFIH